MDDISSLSMYVHVHGADVHHNVCLIVEWGTVSVDDSDSHSTTDSIISLPAPPLTTPLSLSQAPSPPHNPSPPLLPSNPAPFAREL